MSLQKCFILVRHESIVPFWEQVLRFLVFPPGGGGGGVLRCLFGRGCAAEAAKPVPIFKVILAEKGTHY